MDDKKLGLKFFGQFRSPLKGEVGIFRKIHTAGYFFYGHGISPHWTKGIFDVLRHQNSPIPQASGVGLRLVSYKSLLNCHEA
jgi:hypothetical protein